MKEIWRDIHDFEDVYEVSNFGRVRNKKFNRVLKARKAYKTKKYATLSYSLRGREKLGSRLVAQAFIPNPEKKPFVNHIDSNPCNNRVDNLEWCTAAENTLHARNKGRMSYFFGEKNKNSKLKSFEVVDIRERIKKGETCSSIALIYGVSRQNICLIKQGKMWLK